MLNTRAEETSQSVGTGALLLDGAPAGRIRLVEAVGNGKAGYFTVETQDGSQWEEFWGVITAGAPDTVTRNVIRSSNGDAPVDFGSGTKRVYCTPNADAIRFGSTGALPVAGGTANALTLSFAPTVKYIRDGMRFLLFTHPTNVNTAAATLAIDGLAAKAIKKNSGTTDLDAGDLPANLLIEVIYSAAYDVFVLQQIKAVRRIKRTVLVSSGTYTPDPYLFYLEVELQGAGGGGGGAAGGSGAAVGGSGAAGGYSRKIYRADQIGASATVTIGAGGAAGASGNNNGGAGGTTSFAPAAGGSQSANGGGGGTGSTNVTSTVFGGAGGVGGVAAGGDIDVKGASADLGIILGGIQQGHSANGADSHFGSGAPGSYISTAGGQPGASYGSGASGAASAATSYAGGVGGPGVVIITEYCWR